MGAVGGTIWHSIKGARNSPRVRLDIFWTDKLAYRGSLAGLEEPCWSSGCNANPLSLQGDRLIGAISAVKARAPVLGGNVRAGHVCVNAQLTCPRSSECGAACFRKLRMHDFERTALTSMLCVFYLRRTFDCAVKGYRQKEDAWNAITAGFLTGGCLAVRGKMPASRQANESLMHMS